MKPERVIRLFVGLIVLIGSQAVFAQGPPPMPAGEQPEVLTRGPVHEAFAEPVALQVQAGLIVPNQPPANIEEIPPADRPQGEHYVWVPGYWAWDADRSDFIWVSACWRVGPPDTYWVPGYWAQVAAVQGVRRGGVDVQVGGLGIHVGGGRTAPAVAGGWEWVSGFWAPTSAQEIEYLPAPPAPMDLEPPGPPPAVDNIWVPGCWYWQGNQYVRRPGYWLQQQQGWVWEPSHYRWTPRGYVLEVGHWDYSLDRRGVLFAPVYFPRSVYAQAGFSYSPTIAIDLGVLSANLFTYPRYDHYYFGDYYDDAYLSAGIYPQYQSDRFHTTWYDPIYTYDRWHSGQVAAQWNQTQQQQYDRRRSDRTLRPARTYSAMQASVARMPEAQRRNVELARPIQTIAESKGSPIKFEQINSNTRQTIARKATDAHKFRDERAKWEATGSTNPKAVRPAADTTAVAPADRRGPVATPAERREPVAPAVDRRGPATPREPVAPAVERRGPATPAAKDAPVLVSPREVRLDKPERVKVPVQPPIVGRPRTTPGAVENGPPARPVHEQKLAPEAKDAPKADIKDTPRGKDAPKADVKDAPKGKDAPEADVKGTPKEKDAGDHKGK